MIESQHSSSLRRWARVVHGIKNMHASVIICAAMFLIRLPASAAYIPFTHYGQGQGLTDLAVNSLFQDTVGYLWIGTQNGLFRYDGSDFIRYGAPDGLLHPSIRALALGPDNHLWVATPYTIYREQSGRFVPILPEGQLSIFAGGSQIAFIDARTSLAEARLCRFRS